MVSPEQAVGRNVSTAEILDQSNATDMGVLVAARAGRRLLASPGYKPDIDIECWDSHYAFALTLLQPRCHLRYRTFNPNSSAFQFRLGSIGGPGDNFKRLQDCIRVVKAVTFSNGSPQ